MFFLLRRDTQEPGEDLLKIQRTARCGKPGSDAGGRRRLLFHRRPSGLPGDQHPLKQVGIGAVTKPCKVGVSGVLVTFATTSLWRARAPLTGIFPAVPLRGRRLAFGLFRSLPPTYVSSTSTCPTSWGTASVVIAPDPVTHRPRRAVRPRPDHPLNLQRTHPLFTLTQQIDHLEPDGQGILRILEQRAHQRREALSQLVALLALPLPGPGHFIDLGALTPRAPHARRPAQAHEID